MKNLYFMVLLLLAVMLPSYLFSQLNIPYTIELDLAKSEANRFQVFFQQTQDNSVQICGLIPGEEYRLWVNDKMKDGTMNSFNVNALSGGLLLAAGRYNEFRLKATDDCMLFDVDMQNWDGRELLHQSHISISKVIDEPTKVKKPRPEDNTLSVALPPINVDPTPNGEELVQEVFIGGDCYDLNFLEQLGPNIAMGTFSNGMEALGIDEGVILASGNITNALGPNTSEGTGNGLGQPGDVDLSTLANSGTNDATGFVFEFEPTDDTVRFDYVFASDEYCEFVNAGFNDAFGFFLSGPGIDGGGVFQDNAINIARLPISNQQVSINNVNPNSNGGFFVRNAPSCSGSVHPLLIEYDGFTTVLTAVAVVQPCQTYKLKLVVGDAGDDIFDSAVFLKSNSFVTSDLVQVTSELSIPSSDSLYEGCGEACFVFKRQGSGNNNSDVEVVYNINPSSTATPGSDYTPLPSPIIIPAGQDSISVCFEALEDGMAEGGESIIIEIENSCECSGLSDTIWIGDFPTLEVEGVPDTICGGGNATIGVNIEGGAPPIEYEWENGLMTPEITVSPSMTRTYSVTVTDACDQEIITDVEVINNQLPSGSAALSGAPVLCNGNQQVDIVIDLMGAAPFTINYTVNGTAMTETNITASPFILPVTTPGIYSFGTVIDNFGCEGPLVGDFIIQFFELDVDFNVNDPSCPEASDGSMGVFPLNGSGPYTTMWDNGSPNPFINNLMEGEYCVTVTDANDCFAEECEELIAAPPLEVDIQLLEEVDCQNEGGQIRADASNSNGNLVNFEWNNSPSGSSILTNLSEGTYVVTASTAAGCMAIDSITILAPETFEITLEALGDIDCDKPLDGAIDLTTIGGATPFQYDWGPEGTTEDLMNLAQGEYIVEVIDDNDCIVIDTIELFGDFEDPTAFVPPSDTLDCLINQVQLFGEGTSTGNDVSYLWSTTNGTIENGQNTEVATVSSQGNYILTIRDTSNGCLAMDTVEVTDISELPTVDAGADSILSCNVTAITLSGSASGNMGPLTYSWTTGGGGNIVSGADSLTPVVNSSGTYTLTVLNEFNDCTSSDNVFIGIDTVSPNAAAGVDQVLDCGSTSLNLDGSGSSMGSDFTYLWTTTDGLIDNGETTTTPQVSRNGTYTLLVTDTGNGCTSTDVTIVTLSTEIPVVDAGPDFTFTCIDTVFELDGSGSEMGMNITYEWVATNGGNIVSGTDSIHPIVNSPGTYTLTVRNLDNGCENTDVALVLEDTELPVAVAQSDSVINCTYPSVQLNGSGSSLGVDYVYQWTTSDGNIIGGDNSLTPTVDQPGTYTLLVTDVTNGCTAEDAATVLQDTTPASVLIDIPDTLDCVTDSVTITSNASTGPRYIYEWTTADGNILSGASSPNTVVNAAGDYLIRITDTVNGCVTLSSIPVLIDTVSPLADAGEDTLINCYFPEITIGGGNTSVGSEFSYQWNTPNGNIIGVADESTVSIDAAGTYFLTVNNSQNGCSTIDSVIVIDNFEEPVAEAGNTDELNCVRTQITLDGTGSSVGNDFTYLWTTVGIGGNILSGETTLMPVINEPGTYQIEVTDTTNGCSVVDEVIITQDANLPIASAGADRLLTCDIVSIILDGSASSASPTIIYMWNTADGNIVSGGDTRTPTVDAPGTYVLTVEDTLNNCEVTSTIEVTQNITLPTVEIAAAEVLNCERLSITLDASNSDAGTDFDYSWVTADGNIISGDDTDMPEIDAPGRYILRIENNTSGCIDSAFIDILQDTSSPVAVAATMQEITCATPSIQVLGTGSSVGVDFTYEWSTTGGNITSDVNALNTTVNAAGTYMLLVRDSSNGCESMDQVTVIENLNNPVIATTVSDRLDCNISTADLNVTATTDNGDTVLITWTDLTTNAPVGNTANVSVSTPGDYEVIVVDAINGCRSIDTVTVSQDTVSPVAELLPADTLNCEVLQVDLQASNISAGVDFTYSWTTSDGNIVSGANTQTPIVDEPGTYRITVLNIDNGCTVEAAVDVFENVEFPLVNVGADNRLDCITEMLTITPTVSIGNNITYEWTTADGIIDSDPTQAVLEVSTEGTYILSALNSESNCPSSDTLLITQNIEPPTPEITVQGNPVITCDIQEISLDAMASTGQGNLTFQWSTADGHFVGSTTGIEVEIDIPGTYVVVVTDDENGCTAEAQVTVTQDESLPTVAIAEPEILTCDITEIDLDATASSTGNIFDVSWTASGGGNIVSGADSYTPTVNAVGTYRVTILNTDNGCSSFREVRVEEDIAPPLARANSPVEIDCEVTSVPINGNGSSTGSGFTYTWTTADGQITSATNQLTATASAVGTYVLEVRDASNGCTATAATVVRRDQNTPSAVNAGVFQPACFGDNGRISIFEVEGGTPPYEYSFDGQPFSYDVHFLDLPPGIYDLTIRDFKGCEYEETFEIIAAPPLTVDLPEEVSVTLGGADAQIVADVQPPPDSNSQIIWYPEPLLDFRGDTLAPYIDGFLKTGQRFVLTIINETGCEASDEVVIKVDKPRDIYIPNIFSPNKDGINDYVFITAGPNVKQVNKFLIYDRWGERVYQVENFDPSTFLQTNGWDGTFRLEDLNPGVYVYYAEVEYIDGVIIQYEGDITLVR